MVEVQQRHKDAAAWALDRCPDTLTWEHLTAHFRTPEQRWHANRVAQAFAKFEAEHCRPNLTPAKSDAGARHQALEEAAQVADSHANGLRRALGKGHRSDHDVAVFESAISEAVAVAVAIRNLTALTPAAPDGLAEELRALADEATPGPWQHHCSHVYGPDPDRTLVGQLVNGPWLVSDRDLIVALRNNLPTILAALAKPAPTGDVAGLLERLRVSAKWLASFVRDNVGGTGWDLAKIHCAEKHREEVAEAADLITAQAARLKALRSDIFAVLRAHDVSEQCFAEVAMITHAALKGEPT
jgi:hypothetical protein